MTFMRRADGGVWTYFYDENQTITQITDPYGGETRFTLDDQGRPVEEIDPNGNVTKLLYNALGQHDRRINSLGYEFPPLEDDPYPDDPLAYTLPETPLEWEYGHLLDASQIDVLAARRSRSVALSTRGLRHLPWIDHGLRRGSSRGGKSTARR